MRQGNPKSTLRIAGHPVHPMLVAFPIAFLTGAFFTDIVYWQLREAFWAMMSVCLLAAGILTGVMAALAGLTDFLGDRRIRALSHAWQHMIGNLIAILLSLFNLFIRFGDAEAPVLSLGLPISAAVVLILMFTGWRGGDLIYRHRVGIPDDETGDETGESI